MNPERIVLFDGTEASFARWRTVGGGAFGLIDGLIVTRPGHDLGLCYYAAQAFDDFALRVEFRLTRGDENSGVWIRFRDPSLPVPDRHDRSRFHAYHNQAFVAVDTGFEIQIDEWARGNAQKGTPDGEDQHRTGAIYDIMPGPGPGHQCYTRGPDVRAGEWNEYVIECRGDTYRVALNGSLTAAFTNTDEYRGRPSSRDPRSGYVGVQCHTGEVAFRDITLSTLAAPTR